MQLSKHNEGKIMSPTEMDVLRAKLEAGLITVEYFNQVMEAERKRQRGQVIAMWIGVAIFCLVVIWFWNRSDVSEKCEKKYPITQYDFLDGHKEDLEAKLYLQSMCREGKA